MMSPKRANEVDMAIKAYAKAKLNVDPNELMPDGYDTQEELPDRIFKAQY